MAPLRNISSPLHVSPERSARFTVPIAALASLKILKLFADALFVCFQAWTSVPMTGIQCQICHMVFSDQATINAHYGTVHAQSSSRPEHPDARHECRVCGRKFTQLKNLTRHSKGAHGVETFQCDVCSKTFKRKDYLKHHLRKVHKV